MTKRLANTVVLQNTMETSQATYHSIYQCLALLTISPAIQVVLSEDERPALVESFAQLDGCEIKEGMRRRTRGL